MTTSSTAETEARPMRNGGYKADSTSASGSSSSAEVVRSEGSLEKEGKALPLLAAWSPYSSSSVDSLKSGTNEVYACHLCSYVGTTHDAFDLHMVERHYVHRCTVCSYSARTKGRLKRHLRAIHPKDFDDPGNSEGAKPKEPNGIKPKKTRRLKTIRCKYCKFYTVDKNDFWRHLSEHIPPAKQLRCGKCPFVTDLKHHYQYHLRSHDGLKPFRCQKCGYSCVNKSMLNSHSKSHSNVYRFRCAVCAFAAKYSHALKLHIIKYGHSAGPVLNQDGSLPGPTRSGSPPAIPFPRQDGTLPAAETPRPFERRPPFSRHSESLPLRVMPEPEERQLLYPTDNFSNSASNRVSVFYQEVGDISAPAMRALSGTDPFQLNGSLSTSTSSRPALRPDPRHNTSFSLGFETNLPRRAVMNDYAGHPTATDVTDHHIRDKRKHVETETWSKPLKRDSHLHHLPHSFVAESFPSLRLSPFQLSTAGLRCGTVSLDDIHGLSTLLPHPPSLPHPPTTDVTLSDSIQLMSPLVVTSGNTTTASTNTRPFHIVRGNARPISSMEVPYFDRENGPDGANLLPLPGSTCDTEISGTRGEFIAASTRFDDDEVETPLDLTNRGRFTTNAGNIPELRGSSYVDEKTLISPPPPPPPPILSSTLPHLPPHPPPPPPALPSYQTNCTTHFPSSISASPISSYPTASASPQLSVNIGDYDRPPPLLPLSLTLLRHDPKDPGSFQLNDKDDTVSVLTDEDRDLTGDQDHRDYPAVANQESSALEMEDEQDLGNGRTTDSSFEGRGFECRHCRMVFQDYMMFSIHYGHHGDLDPFKCNICGEKCDDRVQFFLHISRVAHN